MKNKEQGFTLVELLVAIVVIGFMVVGVTSLYITLENTQNRTKMMETATRAGEKKIEELRNGHYNSLENGSVIDFTDELDPSLHEPRSATVDVSEQTEGVKRVDVNITYNDGKSSKEIELSSLIGILGIGQ